MTIGKEMRPVSADTRRAHGEIVGGAPCPRPARLCLSDEPPSRFRAPVPPRGSGEDAAKGRRMNTMQEFDGKVALVTGTTGIGLATARRLAEGGAAIARLGIDEAANAAMQAEFDGAGRRAKVVTADVSVPATVRDAIAAGVAAFGGLDIIVNAAAVHPYGTATTTDSETFAPHHGRQCRFDPSHRPFRHPGNAQARRRRHRQRRLGPGLRLPAERRRLRHHQGRYPHADPLAGARLRPPGHPREFGQPRLDPHPDPGEGGARRRTAAMPMSRPPTSASARRTRSAASANRRRWRN